MSINLRAMVGIVLSLTGAMLFFVGLLSASGVDRPASRGWLMLVIGAALFLAGQWLLIPFRRYVRAMRELRKTQKETQK